MNDELIDNLLDLDGVEKVTVKTEVTVTHRRRNTGEIDEHFNSIRERVVSEEVFEEAAERFGLDHLGTVDVVGDYLLKNRFKRYETIDGDDDE